mmetsp:Transcript_32811/g.49468  ORF Transcript_32811/g.49468 Transcript_32811/m.49468 type:complete len:372 (+) Transcript_32811:179-1294(+)
MSIWKIHSLLYMLLLATLFVRVEAGRSNSFNPYSVLGLSEEASQQEIKRNYKKLCLKYHPDKNVQKTPREKKRCEELFKQVQKANEMIGSEESRQRYNANSQFTESYNDYFQRQPYSQNEAYRTFQKQFFSRQPATRVYFGGVDISNFFSSGEASFFKPQAAYKSIYLQKVKISLKDLYCGRSGIEVKLKDTLWNRYKAVFRGGAAGPILYQAVAISLSLMRIISFPRSFVAAALFFHFTLPRPLKLDYTCNIISGWKSGTKLTFKAEPGFNVVFVLDERKDDKYHRVGNNLHTSVTINERQRSRGCTINLELLDQKSIYLHLDPNQISESGGSVKISGKGWPSRGGLPSTGDLIVDVKIVRGKRKKNRKN